MPKMLTGSLFVCPTFCTMASHDEKLQVTSDLERHKIQYDV